ncbi:MAG: winged helix-turn-helix domain-containing protein [Acidimicrobiales bacterium]
MASGRDPLSVDSVALVHWPRDHERRARLTSARVPCLLLVEADAAPPVVNAWEDWIHLPADERDVSTRLQGLVRRVCRPEIVDDAVLRNGYGAVILTTPESAITRALLDADGALVSRRNLERELWPEGPPSTRALDDLVYRLRRRMKPLRLNIFSARGRGFVLGVAIEVTASPRLAESGIENA